MKKIALVFLSVLLTLTVSAQTLLTTKYINLATASNPTNINLASNVGAYYAYGTKTLSAPFAIGVTGTVVNGQTILLFWDGTSVTTGGNSVTLLGVALSDVQAKRKLIVLSIYKTSAWETRIINDAKSTYWLGKDQVDTTNFTDGTTTHIGVGGLRVMDTCLTNAYIKPTANIAVSKLAALTGTRVAITDANGKLSTSSVTPTTLGYLDATSSVQTQLNARPASGAIVNADINGSAAIAYSKLNVANSILNADINTTAGIAYSKLNLTGSVLNADLAGSIALSKLAATTASKALVSDGSGVISPSAVTSTELGYLSGVTSSVQTQLNNANAGVLTYSDINTGTTLTAATIKRNITANTTSGGFNITLPVANTLTAGTWTEVYMTGSNTAKILVQGTDKIINKYGAAVTSDTLTPTYRGVMMYSDGSGNYYIGRKY